MNNIEFYLNNQLVPPPDNWMALLIQVSFMDEDPQTTLNATQLIWKGANANTLNTWLNDGLSGGLGIWEGIPFEIRVCNSGFVVFNGICDLSDENTKFSCDIVNVIIRDMREDMIKQLFQSISWSFLATPVSGGGPTPGPWSINSSDYISIPYQVNNIPDYFEFILCAISIMEVISQVEKIVKELISLISAGVTTFGTILGIPAAVGFVIEVIYWVAELILNMTCVIALIETAMAEIIASVYHKWGMNVLNLMRKACAYFNIGFESSIMESEPMNRLAIMPVKGAWANVQSYSSTLFSIFGGGFSTNNRKLYDDPSNYAATGFAYGYPDGTFKDLFDWYSDYFNAKPRIILDSNGDPVLHFEVWDAIVLDSGVSMPNISEDAPFPQPFQTNASELAANYLVQYQKDEMDVNTYDTYDGTSCYAQFVPINISNPTNVTLKNLINKQLAFAQGVRKTHGTVPEQIFHDFTSVVNGITNLVRVTINSITSLINDVISLLPGDLPTIKPIPKFNLTYQIPIGNLLLTDNSTGVQKSLLLVEGGLLDPTNHTTNDPIAAKKLMKNYHYSSLIYCNDPSGSPYWNQFMKFKQQTIPLCCEDFAALYNTNYLSTFDGQSARVDSLSYNTFKAMAKIDYRIRFQFTKNIKASFMVDGITAQTYPTTLFL